MAKKKSPTQMTKRAVKRSAMLGDLERQLGQLAYQAGKQAEIYIREKAKLATLQKQANAIATTIEKLNG